MFSNFGVYTVAMNQKQTQQLKGTPEIKAAARGLYLQHMPVSEIAERFGVSGRTVYNWRDEGEWDNLIAGVSLEHAISRRIIMLADQSSKTTADLDEMDRLINQLEKLARVRQVEAKTASILKGEAANDGSPLDSKRADKKKKVQVKNDVSGITAEALEKIRKELFYDYQHGWHDNKCQRTRFILKSRQIGATYYFAWEAFEDAILSGDNQIFLSASKNQAEIFKAYMIGFAKKYFDLDLKGSDCITISNGAELRFVSTNGRTAQGYHGHLYIDEVFWIPDFKKLNTLASGMAAHKKWRKTYFSTPSIKSHGAYSLWSGEKFNENRKTKVNFDLSRDALKDGQLGPDKIWRNIVTVEDAQTKGCDLFDIDELRNEYSEAEFNNLFMCAFMEAGLSVFRLGDLLNCAVDSNVVWVDFKKGILRPYGNKPVWVGYDPARIGDKSAVVVVAVPLSAGEKFRVLESINLRGAWRNQANEIKALCEKYNVAFMGIDCTGPGNGVFEMVQTFFPRATPIHYGLDTKTKLVLKAQDVVEHGRIEWDAEHTDIPQSFLQITQTITGSDQITYAANRTRDTGHADKAWAIMHALSNEPLNTDRRKSGVAMG
jgi:uncharacterized protein YjcR